MKIKRKNKKSYGWIVVGLIFLQLLSTNLIQNNLVHYNLIQNRLIQSVSAVDTTPPSAPTILNSDQTIYTHEYTVNWTSTTRTDYYKVFINDSLTTTTTYTGCVLSFISSNTYLITVKSTNSYGDSDASNTLTLIVNLDGPEKPIWITQSQKTARNREFKLEWNPVSNAAGYYLFLNETLNETLSSTSVLLDPLSEIEYNFYLQAYNDSGLSENSSTITILTGEVPPIPNILTKNQSIYVNQLIIEWNNVAGAHNYTVFINSDPAYTTSDNFQYVNFTETGKFYINITANNEYGRSDHSQTILIDVLALNPVTKWNLESLYIHGLGLYGNGTWEDFENHPWLLGDGSVENPYIIQNIIFSTNKNTSALLINNTDRYFEIRDVTVVHAGNSSAESFGIRINDCSDFSVYNNVISNINNGISIENSMDFEIFNNQIENTSGLEGSGALCLNHSDWGMVYNNEIFNSIIGLYLDSSTNNEIVNNNLINESFSIVELNCFMNNITGNSITNYGIGYGCYGSKNSSFTDNSLVRTSESVNSINNSAIVISSLSENLTIANNSVSDGSKYGLEIHSSSRIDVLRNEFNNQLKNCTIFLENSNSINIVGNILSSEIIKDVFTLDVSMIGNLINRTLNSSYEFYSGLPNTIKNKFTWDEAVQKFRWFEGKGTAADPYRLSNISFELQDNSIPLTLKNLTANLIIEDCNFSAYENNPIEATADLYLYGMNNTQIINSQFTEYYQSAIILDRSNNISITECYFNSKNYGSGIRLTLSKENYIYNNYFTHLGNGINFYYDGDYSIVSNNTFTNNNHGIICSSNSKENLIFENSFISNTVHALDYNTDPDRINHWNNSIIGNYWDNYTGVDYNFDSIGDTPYTYIEGSANAIDYLPICYIQPPEIKINQPVEGVYFNASISEIQYNVEITDESLDTMWYCIIAVKPEINNLINNGVIKNHTFTSNGTIDPGLYDSLPDENEYILVFYANDTDGLVNSAQIKFIKDGSDPRFTIVKPVINRIYNDTAPYIELVVNETYLKTISYSIKNLNDTNSEWSEPVVFSGNGTIDSALWASIGSDTENCTIAIKIVVADEAGNTGENVITVVKSPAGTDNDNTGDDSGDNPGDDTGDSGNGDDNQDTGDGANGNNGDLAGYWWTFIAGPLLIGGAYFGYQKVQLQKRDLDIDTNTDTNTDAEVKKD